MPEQQPGLPSSRDFAFQSTDQPFARGADAATTSARAPLQQHAHRYENDAATHASNAPPDARQTAPDALLRSYAPQQSPDSFNHYAYSPGGPLVWDWNNSIDFADFAHHYEPQGELVQELQNQNNPLQDFSIPLPVSVRDPIYQSPLQTPTLATNVQNPLSPPPPPLQRPTVSTNTAAMKRKAPSEPSSAASASVSAHLPDVQQPASKRAAKSRSSSIASANTPALASAASDRLPSTSMAPGQATTVTAAGEGTSSDLTRRKSDKAVASNSRQPDHARSRRIVEAPGRDTSQLPAGKVFPIQIGSELFRLSGASISSDAPSYFSHFFAEQLHHTTGRAGDLRTLYIDRDPVTFRDISLHLQGYHVKPRDPQHFVRLFADAQFYSLPRLTKQLFNTDIFIRVGQRDFQISRDLFSSPGDSPNYFSLGFAQFFTTPAEVFPGLDRDQLLRPPSITPPSVPGRNGDTFAELLKLLQGYQVHIRDENHRAELLRDARYFHLKGLEQRLIPCDISFNLARSTSEILVRLEDIRQSGVSFTPDTLPYNTTSTTNIGSPPDSTSKTHTPTTNPTSVSGSGTVSYARPYTDDHANTNILILEIGSSESTRLHFPPSRTASSSPSSSSLNLRATFHGQTLARITSLFSVAAAKMGLPATQPLGLMMLQSGGGVAAQPVSPANSGVSESRVRVRWETDAWVELDGVAVEVVRSDDDIVGVRKMSGSTKDEDEDDTLQEIEKEENNEWVWGGTRQEDRESEWIVKKAHWRLRVEPVDSETGRMQIVMCPVRIEAMASERTRNKRRRFLG